MDTKIDLESEPGVSILTAFGSMTLDDIKGAAQALWQATEGKSLRLLWDLRSATFVLDANQVRELAEFTKKLIDGPTLRSAFVVAGDLEFGLVRMFLSLSFREVPGPQTRVFRDRKLALAWLREPRAPSLPATL